VIAGSGMAHLDGVDHPLHAGLFLRLPPGLHCRRPGSHPSGHPHPGLLARPRHHP
jgi:hypothetical protein